MQTAKLFMNGRSQAIRLPLKYRFDCDEVFIRQDKNTGDIILSRKPNSWDDFFSLVDNSNIPDDFMATRENDIPNDKDLF